MKIKIDKSIDIRGLTQSSAQKAWKSGEGEGSLSLSLPLPPSKNVRRTMISVRGRRIPIVSSVVKTYRSLVAAELGGFNGRFPDKTKIVLECIWHKRTGNQDCSNFHDELCDAIAPALGLNDKYFLVRDIDYVVEPKDPKVEITMWALEAITTKRHPGTRKKIKV